VARGVEGRGMKVSERHEVSIARDRPTHAGTTVDDGS
jgi:hypothetical protein